MIAERDIDLVAAAVRDVLETCEGLGVIRRAAVSAPYLTGRTGQPNRWRVCVAVNDSHAWQPAFPSREVADEYREAVDAALGRLT